ncbi:MAG: DUF4097 domain-containing protein [Acidobacteria bacterium]|nr:DUF4097 domain-containing protein [Acidobacteriota bacterium]
MQDIRGNALLKTRFGEIEAVGISGNATLNNSNAAIKLSRVTGIADVRGSFGAVTVSGVGKSAKVISGNGAVTVSGAEGETYVKSSFGSVRADRIGGKLTVETNNGSVSAKTVKGGVFVRNSFSPVYLDGIQGGVEVYNQNGSIEVAGLQGKPVGAQACPGLILKTSFAPIRVYLPEGGSFAVTARTSFGRINSELPLTVSGSLGNDSLTGKIGTGECDLNLTNANGNIDILKAVPRKPQ